MTLRTAHASVAVLLIALSLAVGVAPNSAQAFSDWPSRTVKLIVPFPAGSVNDVAARLYSEGLARRWARPVIVENTPGADAILVGGAFTNARDDHTLLYGTASTITVNSLLHGPLPYDAIPDMVAIAPGAGSVFVIAVTDGLPARSLKDLVELVRAKPDELSWGAGPSLPYFAFAATLKRHHLRMVHVPYRDPATPEADLSEGRVHVLSNSLQAVAGPVAAGKARILAVTSPQREPLLPDVPTVAEAGFPEMEIEGLSGLFGWRDMPPELRDRIAADMRAVADDAALRAHLEASGQRVLAGTPAEFAAAIGRQRIRLQQILHFVDLKHAAK